MTDYRGRFARCKERMDRASKEHTIGDLGLLTAHEAGKVCQLLLYSRFRKDPELYLEGALDCELADLLMSVARLAEKAGRCKDGDLAQLIDLGYYRWAERIADFERGQL